MSKTPACLFGAGILGHTWVATRTDVGDGEQILCQTSFGADAVRIVDDSKVTLGAYYERVNRKAWRKRTRAYALLDQPTDGRKPYEPASEEASP